MIKKISRAAVFYIMQSMEVAIYFTNILNIKIKHYIKIGNLDAIQFLLMDGHSVDTVDHGGWTPLIRLASMNGSRDAAEILMKYKANVDIYDSDKKNALIIAVLTGNLPLVECLIDNGADLTLTNEYGKTAYDIAISLDKRVRGYFIVY